LNKNIKEIQAYLSDVRSWVSGSGERIQKPLGPLAVTRPATSWTPGFERSVICLALCIMRSLLTSSIQRRQEPIAIDGRNGDSGCTRRIAIVAALCADLSHPSCNWIYQLLKYNIAVACCQKVVAILVDDRTIHHISWGTWACEAPDDALFGS
jgi:hypothetical protein